MFITIKVVFLFIKKFFNSDISCIALEWYNFLTKLQEHSIDYKIEVYLLFSYNKV
jgi:hypothetical protein